MIKEKELLLHLHGLYAAQSHLQKQVNMLKKSSGHLQEVVERRKSQNTMDAKFKLYLKTNHPEVYKEVVAYIIKQDNGLNKPVT